MAPLLKVVHVNAGKVVLSQGKVLSEQLALAKMHDYMTGVPEPKFVYIVFFF